MNKEITLASKSLRRQQILRQVNIAFTIRTAHIDEKIIKTEDPIEKVTQLATLKNVHLPFKHDHDIIVSADTVISFRNNIFEKPRHKEEAYYMLSQLSGQTHDVYTGVMIRTVKEDLIFVEATEVEFWPLEKSQIEAYINTEEPYDKAGGYGIQSVGALFVKAIVGDYYNVVGLPISRLMQSLKKVSID